jgi:hypothetical protein
VSKNIPQQYYSIISVFLCQYLFLQTFFCFEKNFKM